MKRRCQSLLLTEKYSRLVFTWFQNTGDTFIFCGKAISFNFTADLYIHFPTSNKMAIIGTLPSQFSDKNQQLYKGSLICTCTGKFKITSTGKGKGFKTKKIRCYQCSAIFSRSICYFFFFKVDKNADAHYHKNDN